MRGAGRRRRSCGHHTFGVGMTCGVVREATSPKPSSPLREQPHTNTLPLGSTAREFTALARMRVARIVSMRLG